MMIYARVANDCHVEPGMIHTKRLHEIAYSKQPLMKHPDSQRMSGHLTALIIKCALLRCKSSRVREVTGWTPSII